MAKKVKKANLLETVPDAIVKWVGTTSSLLIHSAFFLFSFLAHWIFGASFDSILLVLTTIVSLEAIYLAIFIQRSVNQQATRLSDVEESLTKKHKSEKADSHVRIESAVEQIIEELKTLKTQINKENNTDINSF